MPSVGRHESCPYAAVWAGSARIVGAPLVVPSVALQETRTVQAPEAPGKARHEACAYCTPHSLRRGAPK